MLLKKIIGTLIILLNIGGLGFLLYIAGLTFKKRFFPARQVPAAPQASDKKKEIEIVNDDIVSDEDDLLKDMDLSDLDNLNLDDFE